MAKSKTGLTTASFHTAHSPDLPSCPRLPCHAMPSSGRNVTPMLTLHFLTKAPNRSCVGTGT